MLQFKCVLNDNVFDFKLGRLNDDDSSVYEVNLKF